MDYSNLSDAEINRAVAGVMFPGYPNITPYSHRPDVQIFHKNNCYSMKDFCNSWADAGPIAVQHRISINAHGRRNWLAFKNKGKTLTQIADRKNQLSEICSNPCRAICIVFLMMNEGE